MALYANRLQVPIKELSADWIPEEGELFQDSSDNLYMGDNVTASNALTPINGGGGGGDNTIEHDPFGYSDTTNPSGIGIGVVRFNSTTFGSITKMYVSDNDQNAVDLTALQGVMTSGLAKLYKADGGNLSFQVTRMVDQSGYFEYDVAPLSGTMPTVGEVCYVDFVPDAPGVREFNFLLTTGVGTATIEVLRDTMTETPDVNYISTGVIRVELTGAFPTHKVETSFSALTKIIDAGDTPSNIQCTQDPNYIGIITYDDSFTPQDLAANDLLITIKVYP
jgi:hypothetical protein